MTATPAAQTAIFHLDGDSLIPGDYAHGPWYADSQHGSAMLGLLARAVERHPCEVPMQVTRLTVDLMRAAPMRPVTTPTRTLRIGRSTDLVEATLEADGRVYARASAMRFRLCEIDTSTEAPVAPAVPLRLPSGDETPPGPRFESVDDKAFHLALEMRPPLGHERPAMWFRLRHPLVAGEPLTPFVRVATIADWTYSVPFMHRMMNDPSARAERSFSAINPDTTVNLHRPMEGEWLCLDSHIQYGNLGAGTALATLQDLSGAIGHSSQSILIRDAAFAPTADRQAQG